MTRPPHALAVLAALALVGSTPAALAAPPAAPAQDVPFLTQARPAGWDLWIVDETGAGKQLVAADVELLPITLEGRARIDRLRPGLPQQGGDGAPRVVLPGGGTLLRTRAAGTTSLRAFDDGGVPALVLAAPDGLAGDGLLASVAVSRDGTRVLALAPEPSFGAMLDVVLGDLGGAPPIMLATVASVEPASLRVSAERAFFVADGALYRADLLAPVPAAVPVDLDLQPGETIDPVLVTAGDGRSVALTTSSPTARRVHVVDPAGTVTCVTPTPGPFDAAGLDALDGPYLALNEDGSLLAYRATPDVSDVIVRVLARPAPTVLTGDGTFTDTIDNAGVLAFVGPLTLGFVAGEKQVGQAVDAGDLFEAAIDPFNGATTITNITATSGFTSPPILATGDIDMVELALSPDGARWLVTYDPDGGDAALGSIPTDAGTPTPLQPLLGPLAAPPTLIGAGDVVLIDALPESTGGPSERRLLRLLPGQAPVLVGSVPPAVTFSRVTVNAAGSQAAFVVSAGASAEVVVRLGLATGALALPFPFLGQVSAQLAFSPAGRLVFGFGGGGDTFVFAAFDGPLQGTKLPLPVGDGLPVGR